MEPDMTFCLPNPHPGEAGVTGPLIEEVSRSLTGFHPFLA